jgi:hypothetical protein
VLWALAGVNIATTIAFLLVLRALIGLFREQDAEHALERRELYTRIQAPETPQLTFLPRPPAGSRRKLSRTEDDEVQAGLERQRADREAALRAVEQLAEHEGVPVG